MPKLRGMRAVVQFLRQFAEPRAAPPTSPFMALLTDPRAVKAQARFPRPFVSLWLHSSCCSARRPRDLLTQNFGDQIADLSRFPQLGVDTFRVFSQEQATTEGAEQSPGLVAARGSFETVCPSRGVARDHARECHRRGPAKLGEQLLVSVSQNDVPDRAARKRAVVQRFF